MIKKKYASLQSDINEEVDKSNLYMDALNWALKEKCIKNLAITGSFGSGKSTIIQKFISNYEKIKSFL